ncbi:hypothetical protein BDB00DRAFT_819933 [Zychaea mexicana]|uniref:uncharacterized protein n=1 Tax=Zychaea mexicana TaxID=64656 RepID=UPI0022FDE9FA|nr:uncharacterized protein BDB00DRAFT_819933 [Zychaea mexicana]KAI9494169.1 hypothetical protein BDB00DRAFT_819933 [Zychaea mexicana]
MFRFMSSKKGGGGWYTCTVLFITVAVLYGSIIQCAQRDVMSSKTYFGMRRSCVMIKTSLTATVRFLLLLLVMISLVLIHGVYAERMYMFREDQQ